MKKLSIVALYCLCGVVAGFAVGAVAWGVPEYRSMKANLGSDYLSFFGSYAYVQYKQAAPREARQALRDYLHVIDTLKSKNIPQLESKLTFESALTYLRLYRLAEASNNASEAEEDMKNAQREGVRLGWTDVSPASLKKMIDTRESSEKQNDGKLGTLPYQGSSQEAAQP